MSTTRIRAVLIAQFCSAFGDNALLFAAIAVLQRAVYPEWSIPLLQEFFVLAYIVLAPFVGAVADAYPKGRVMLWSNGLKLAGAAAMAIGANPFAAYALVGAGAAAYSPAKYGILSELVEPEVLVKANGWLEASTIAAILFGAIVGGVLSDGNLHIAFTVVIATYALAAIANLYIPRLRPAHPTTLRPAPLLKRFVVDVKLLFRDPHARLSLLGTSAFWGAGSTMRFMLVAWVPLALGVIGNALPAQLNAVTAVAVVFGAVAAGRLVRLQQAGRVLPAGCLIGVAIAGFAVSGALGPAIGFCALIGALGGFFVVPLNALLQERGHETVGAGSAIAVQNLCENMAMLLMVGVWTGLSASGVDVISAALGFGLGFSVLVGVIWLAHRRIGPTPVADEVQLVAEGAE